MKEKYVSEMHYFDVTCHVSCKHHVIHTLPHCDSNPQTSFSLGFIGVQALLTRCLFIQSDVLIMF